ncbi:MAG: PHP domain-containing protein [Chloroflexi bacterium]|nr:PHP domain-containing protein [Chloroflexota bacterium]
MGSAILHVHSTFSDGMATVNELLDELENNSDIDIIGITDHDDCRSFESATDWKASHPGSRIQPIWGVELTAFGFTHVLGYKLQPPFPTVLPSKFLALRKAVSQLKEMGCYVVVPHVDAPVVGMGRRRLKRFAAELGFFGYELFTPYFTSPESLPELRAIGERAGLVPLGGPDAHFIEDIYRVILHFPGRTLEDFERSWWEGTVVPEIGSEGRKKTLRQWLRQHHRSLVEQPSQQMRAWAQQRVNGHAEVRGSGRRARTGRT